MSTRAEDTESELQSDLEELSNKPLYTCAREALSQSNCDWEAAQPIFLKLIKKRGLTETLLTWAAHFFLGKFLRHSRDIFKNQDEPEKSPFFIPDQKKSTGLRVVESGKLTENGHSEKKRAQMQIVTETWYHFVLPDVIGIQKGLRMGDATQETHRIIASYYALHERGNRRRKEFYRELEKRCTGSKTTRECIPHATLVKLAEQYEMSKVAE